jgi:antitoxin (DNA-binding transcriptional repressor) of toxin-antitoxin stability system
MQTIKVGIREFRTHLPQYLLEAGAPLAITRHGETIGYFIPSREAGSMSDVAALKAAAAKLDTLLQAAKLDEDDLVSEFRSLRASNET